MPLLLRKNFSRGFLASGISDSDVQITVSAGHTLPTDAGDFMLVIWDTMLYVEPGQDPNVEIVQASYSGTPNIYDIVRAQEDTVAVSHVSGVRAGLHYTAGTAENNITEHTHATSAIVSGTFVDARIAESNITQHQGAIDHGSIVGLGDDDHSLYHTDGRAATWLAANHETTYNHGNYNDAYSHISADGSSHSIVGSNTTAIGLNTTHRGVSSGNPHSVTPTELSLVIGTNTQAYGDVLDDFNTLGAVGANSEFLVGTGAGALAWENAATAATSMGLGTGDAVTHDTLTLTSVAAEGSDVDKFLVDSTGVVKYRTGAQVLSDIEASATSHRHNTETLEYDGLNSDGGAFSFTTTGAVTFNQSIASANYTAANLLTAAATNAGALDFSAASKTLTVEDDAVVSQDYTSDAVPTFAGAVLSGTTAIGLDMSGGTFATAVQNWPTTPVIQSNGAQIIKFDNANSNTFVGLYAFNNYEGEGNVGFGDRAGFYNNNTAGFEGQYNVYLGDHAGYGNGAGDKNTGSYNVAIGSSALRGNRSGLYQVAIGALSLYLNSTGHFNCAIGFRSFYKTTTGKYNTGIGVNTGYGNVDGIGNTYIGSHAGYVNVDGIGNTFLGTDSGRAITTGSGDVFIGYKSGRNQTAISDRLIIDNQDRGSAAAEITDCLMYGVFNATPASQSLRLNVGNLYLGNPTHSDADGGGLVTQTFIREDGAGTATSTASIAVSHDGSGANDQLGKIVASVNTGAGLAQALEIGSDLLATFAGNITSANYTAVNLLTACATNAGALDFTAASKTLSIDETETISNYHTDSRAATWLAANHETTYTHGDIASNTTHRGLASGNPHSVTPTELSLVIGTNTQAFGSVLDDLNTLGAPVSDGQFIVATGAGTFAYESTTTAATSLGLGTGDGVQFTTLGVGIARTEGTVHIHTASAGTVTASTGGDDLIVEGVSEVGMSILSADNSWGGIIFGSESNNAGAYIRWDYDAETNGTFTIGANQANAQVIFLGAAGAETMRFDENRNVGIRNSNPESQFTVGTNSTVQGVIRLWDGGGGNTPGHVIVGSPNGTLWYLFVEDDGTVKVHNAVPTANADGTVVGSQS